MRTLDSPHTYDGLCKYYVHYHILVKKANFKAGVQEIIAS